MKGAFETGEYRNVFKELGYSEQEVNEKIKKSFNTVFYGSEEERFFHKTEGGDMGYFVDTGNNDARTEGMSYGMMMCVQMDWQEEFNCFWKWAKTYMYNEEGKFKGYFGWSCKLSGEKNSEGPAPDGEEYFAMALFFASHRWGDGEGIFNYSKEARQILHDCLHREDDSGLDMWNPENKLIRFVPGCPWTDPSYHLPHFYELFSLWANEEDREFWKEAAKASRDYLKKACHPVTGLAAEYSEYDGTPYGNDEEFNKMFGSRHDWFYSDAYRVAANLGLDYEWTKEDEWNCECADKIQKFFSENVSDDKFMTYEIDGTVIDQPALHPVAIIATNAMASLAAKGPYSEQWVRKFYDTELRTGERRYYDNCLYLFALLALSGNYRIWK